MRGSFWTVLLLAAVAALTSAGVYAQDSKSCLTPPHGLVSWWPGDGNKNDVVGENNASESDAVSFSQGEVGSGLSFGSGGWMKIPASPSLANPLFTWTAWVRSDGPVPTNDAYGSVILGQISQGPPMTAIQLLWRETDSKFVFLFGHPKTDQIVSEHSFPQGSFYSIAGEYDGANYKLFVNGSLEGSIEVNTPLPYSKTAAWLFGQGGLFALSSHPRTWNGVIDEVQAFNRALPQAELEGIYRAGSKGQCKTKTTIQMAKETQKDVASSPQQSLQTSGSTSVESGQQGASSADLSATKSALPAKASVSKPVTRASVGSSEVDLTECDGEGCGPNDIQFGKWSFKGDRGEAHWNNGASAKLTVIRSDDDGIKILRTDNEESSSAGLTAMYTGFRDGNEVRGTVTMKWPSHWGADRGVMNVWHGTLEKLPASDNDLAGSIFKFRREAVVPAASTHTPPPPNRYDLSGVWEYDSGRADWKAFVGMRLSIYQVQGFVIARYLSGKMLLPPNSQYFVMKFDPDDKPRGVIRNTSSTEPGKLVWENTELDITDPDHFAFANVPFRRVSTRIVGDSPCDPANSAGISGEEASDRAQAYHDLKDSAMQVCWDYVGAVAGSVESQGVWSYDLINARGVEKNLEEGFFWAQKAAIQGDPNAESTLSEDFHDGIAVPVDLDRAEWWKARWFAHAPERIYDEKFIATLPQRLTQTVGPCNTETQNSADGNLAYEQGRVAVSAMLFHLGNCWLRVAANLGEVRADKLLSADYKAGYGVEKNPLLAFQYMKTAADSGDLYAEGYLAEYYHDGVGVPASFPLAEQWRAKLESTQKGQEVWADIRDYKGKSFSFLSAVLGVLGTENRDSCIAFIEAHHPIVTGTDRASCGDN